MKIFFAILLSLGMTALAQQKQPDDKSPSGIAFKDIPDTMRTGMFGDIKDGDTLLEVNERRIKRAKELEEIFKDIKPGTDVKYKFTHDGKVEERKTKKK